MYRYEKDGEEFVLRSPQGIVYRGREIGIAFSYDPTSTPDNLSGLVVLHKHGNPKTVMDWHNSAVAAIRASSFPEFANEFRMVISDHWDVDDLNCFLESSLMFHRFAMEQLLNEPVPV